MTTTGKWCQEGGVQKVVEEMAGREDMPSREFTPMKVAGGPQNGLAVGEVRVTLGHYADGRAFSKADLWKELKDAHSLRAKPWTGCTTFITIAEFKERFRDF